MRVEQRIRRHREEAERDEREREVQLDERPTQTAAQATDARPVQILWRKRVYVTAMIATLTSTRPQIRSASRIPGAVGRGPPFATLVRRSHVPDV